jgi:hypothetical protein
VLCAVTRFERNEISIPLCDNLAQIVTIERRHVTRPTVRTIIVAGARPLVAPFASAVITLIVVSKPSHDCPLSKRVRLAGGVTNTSAAQYQGAVPSYQLKGFFIGLKYF